LTRAPRATTALLVVLVLIAVVAAAVLLLHPRHPVPGRRHPLTAHEYAGMLGVGVDVDWLSFRHVEAAYFHWRSLGVCIPCLFKKRGFDTVRIRVSFDVTRNQTLLMLLKEVVDDSLRAGLNPVIAYGAPELREHPLDPAAQRHFVEWWIRVAEALKDEPYRVAYDLLIESSGPIKDHPEVLNKVYQEVIEAVRRIDPYRIIMVTPARVSSPFMLHDLNITNDGYLIAEWHIYAGGPCRKKKGIIRFNATLIEKAVEAASEWSRKTGIPTWVGAWRPVCPDPHRRGYILGTAANYTEFAEYMCMELKKHRIPFALNADEWFFNIISLTWRSDTGPILDAIMRCWHGD